MTQEVLRAPLVVEYPFSRTLGPAASAFLTGLREQVVLGVRGADGRVIVPPVEYDPVTAAELSELVEVGTSGEVTTWTWVPEPRPEHPVDHPFAFALVKLDGADVPFLHAVDAPEEAMATGMRVSIKWADEREGHITDIACFVPEAEAQT
jgi:uncharacterized OB-fold protein